MGQRDHVLRLLGQLEEQKRRFSPADSAALLRLIGELSRARFPDAASLIRFHEALLFVRAYPINPHVAAAADAILGGFSALVKMIVAAGADPGDFEDPEVSGIAGTAITGVFSHSVVRRLVRRHGAAVSIDWELYDNPDRLATLLPQLTPFLDEDAQVEPHVPYKDWLLAASGGGGRELAWLIERLERLSISDRERGDRFDALEMPVRWQFGDSFATRTLMRLPVKKLFLHDSPLIRRSEVSLDEIPRLSPLPLRKLPTRRAEEILDLARDTSAARFRMLHGFTYGDPRHVYEVQAGRGVVFYLSGIGPERRLPLRAYHAATMWKNGVPVGYFEGLSFFERMDAGFNLYYTFREGETAWLYARLLQMFHQALGVKCFAIDPYQIGHENEEAIEAGAFWFYRKLGFRPAAPELARLAAAEERKIASRPGYRTPPRTLRRLARSHMIYGFPGLITEDWDRFSMRRLAMALMRGKPLKALDRALRLKRAPEESAYLRSLQRAPELRRKLIELGSG